MRTILFAAGALTLAAPAALSAQQQQPGGPEAQTAAEANANAQAQAGPATTTVTTTPARTTVTTNVPGNLTPPPAAAMNKSYPVCSRTVQDSCQNAGEGGAPGRSRALNYWPGEPASERRR